MEQLSSLQNEAAMIRAIVVPVKHGIPALMLALKESETKSEAIPVHMQPGQTATKHSKDKDETPKHLLTPNS